MSSQRTTRLPVSTEPSPDPLNLETPTASEGSVEDKVDADAEADANVDVGAGAGVEVEVPVEVGDNQEEIIQEEVPPWFLRPRTTWAKNEHPYELKYTGMVASDGGPAGHFWAVEFWPFVGAAKPAGPPPGEGSWDDWNGVVAISGYHNITLAKCSKERGFRVTEAFELDDELFDLAWSYHPHTFHPILAAGGQQGIVWIIDVITKEMRAFQGHGHEVLSVEFSPHLPHIVASASRDKSVRIWNIMGGDLAPGQTDLSANYPMGQADEGTCLVAVLGGDGLGGHRWDVCALAWHPLNRAIASGSVDRTVKIWALPELPDATPLPDTPKGYRPHVIYFPVFSTSRIHGGPVDSIAWLTEDVLVTHATIRIVQWQWLGYRRFFSRDQYAPLGLDVPQYHDYHDSHSLMVQHYFPCSQEMWYKRIAVHHAFNPRWEQGDDGDGCTSVLVAVCKVKTPPQVELFNPDLAIERPQPVITDLRPGWVDRAGSDDPHWEDYDDSDSKTAPYIPEAPAPLTSDIFPWTLINKAWRPLAKKQGVPQSIVMEKVAISPRGAKWVIAVGPREAIFVWGCE